MNLQGARVWLTGASSGIGEALVAPLVTRGARVGITARREDRLAAIAARFGGPFPAPVVVAAADVTDRAAVASAAAQVESDLGAIDLAIFNAGGLEGDDDPFDARTFVETMALNYFSVVYGVEAVLPGMLARGRGRLAAVASLAAYRALPRRPAYGASKAAVLYLMESLRQELAPHGIGVTTINPGFVRTPLTARNRFPMPFLMDVDRAAALVLRGLQRDRAEIHFPAMLSWPLKLLRVMPRPVYERVMRLVAARAARDARG